MREKQREETRSRLYLAALEVFRRDGVERCRIEDIARLAQVSRGAFYSYFPTKDDVLLELLRHSQQPVAEALGALPDSAPIEVVLHAATDSMANFWLSEPKLVVDVFSASIRRTAVMADREAEVIRSMVGHRFRALAERGELSPLMPSDALADFFLLCCMATMMSWSTSPALPLQDMLRSAAELFLHGALGDRLPGSPR